MQPALANPHLLWQTLLQFRSADPLEALLLRCFSSRSRLNSAWWLPTFVSMCAPHSVLCAQAGSFRVSSFTCPSQPAPASDPPPHRALTTLACYHPSLGHASLASASGCHVLLPPFPFVRRSLPLLALISPLRPAIPCSTACCPAWLLCIACCELGAAMVQTQPTHTHRNICCVP